MDKSNFCVYKHTTPNNKVYIGITCQDPNERWKKGFAYRKNKHFFNAIEKYGWDNIQHEILLDGISSNEAYEWEKIFIVQYKSNDRRFGYNNSSGGEHGFYGGHHTDEAKRKISAASSKRRLPPETYEKIANSKRKKVVAFDIDGNYICEANSLSEMEKITGINNSCITACCKGKYQQIKGYIFRYKDNDLNVQKVRCKRKPVLQYTLDMEFIQRFESIKEAGRICNIADTHITDCCKGKYTQSGGFVWRYA